jgi:hypothetical protein
MQSAFGIDHGGIAKAVPRLPRRGLTSAQRRTQGRGGPSGPQQVKGMFNRIGEADVSLKGIGSTTGRGVKGVGGFLERRPGLTGAALVGGGGAAGYQALSNKEPKRKKVG